MELVLKDITRPRLTIARNRVTAKFPNTLYPTRIMDIFVFFNEITKEVGTPKYTLRGALHNNKLVLRDTHKNIVHIFVLKVKK